MTGPKPVVLPLHHPAPSATADKNNIVKLSPGVNMRFFFISIFFIYLLPVQLSSKPAAPFYNLIKPHYNGRIFRILKDRYTFNLENRENILVRAATLKPNSRNNWWNLADFYRKTAQTNKMIRAWNKYRNLLSSASVSRGYRYYLLARSYQLSDNPQKAAGLFDQSLKTGWRHYRLYYNAAYAFAQAGKITRAKQLIVRYFKIVKIKPKSSKWFNGLINLYLNNGYLARGLLLCRRYAALFPKVLKTYENTAGILLRMSKTGKLKQVETLLLPLARRYCTINKITIKKTVTALNWFKKVKKYRAALNLLHELHWALQNKGHSWYRILAEAELLALTGEHGLAYKKLRELYVHRKQYGAGPGELNAYQGYMEQNGLAGRLPGIIQNLKDDGYYNKKPLQYRLIADILKVQRDKDKKNRKKQYGQWVKNLQLKTVGRHDRVYYIKKILFKTESLLPVELQNSIWKLILKLDANPVQWSSYGRWLTAKLFCSKTGSKQKKILIAEIPKAVQLLKQAYRQAPNLYKDIPFITVLSAAHGNHKQAEIWKRKAYFVLGKKWTRELPDGSWDYYFKKNTIRLTKQSNLNKAIIKTNVAGN